MKDNLVRVTLRFNIDNAQHRDIVAVINDLDSKVFPSRNQFIIDALDFYINHFGEENITKQKDGNGYITTDDIEALKKQITDDVMDKVRSEMINAMCSALVGASGGIRAVATSEEPESDEAFDETLIDLASDWA